MDLLNSKDSRVFKVNGQILKPYAVQHTIDKEEIPLLMWVWSLQKFLGHPKILLRVCLFINLGFNCGYV